jgi:hypothetical protein
MRQSKIQLGLSNSDRIILDTLLPPSAHPELPEGALDAGFEDFWREYRKNFIPTIRAAFSAALFAANWVSPLLIRKLPPLARYNRQTREAALRAMSNSGINLLRQGVRVMKLMVSFCYGANARVRKAIGYPYLLDSTRKLVQPHKLITGLPTRRQQ